MIALSIRQPWAWLIVHGFKDIENRTWSSGFRGEFLIHASKGMTREEYGDARDFTFLNAGACLLPNMDDLERGGIIGAAKMIDCVRESSSPWFSGPYGFVLRDAIAIPFVPCKGQLGWFEYRGHIEHGPRDIHPRIFAEADPPRRQ